MILFSCTIFSPLDDAYRHKHFTCVEYLQSVGGSFGSSSQATNFIAAASEGDIDEVQTLFRLGNIDINEGDYDRRTALHLAAGNGHYHVIDFLCKSGADVNVVDRWGGKPLDDAQLCGHTDCLELLQKFGAKHGNSDNATLGREALIDLFGEFMRPLETFHIKAIISLVFLFRTICQDERWGNELGLA